MAGRVDDRTIAYPEGKAFTEGGVSDDRASGYRRSERGCAHAQDPVEEESGEETKNPSPLNEEFWKRANDAWSAVLRPMGTEAEWRPSNKGREILRGVDFMYIKKGEQKELRIAVPDGRAGEL